jgi:toxin FitB
MKYLLDTCVVSEFFRNQAHDSVIAFINSIPNENLFLSTLTIGELHAGVPKVKDLVKSAKLIHWIEGLKHDFTDRIISFDLETSEYWGNMKGELSKRGINLPIIDSMIAAIALSKNAILVTRNTKDFEATGVKLLNPWLE